jgi:hypothetical protein
MAHTLLYKPERSAVFDYRGGWAYYFVAKHYADNNPDLKAAFGYNKVELWNHCVRYGIKHYERQYERAR